MDNNKGGRKGREVGRAGVVGRDGGEAENYLNNDKKNV